MSSKSPQTTAATPTPLATESGEELDAIARHVLDYARQRGASAAECVIREGREFSVTVRLGQVEQLKEAGGKALGIRVFRGQRAASTYSSDFARPAVERMVDSALELAALTSEDPCAGLPEAAELGQYDGELELYEPATASLDAAVGIEMARRAEQAALEVDARLSNSDGGSFDAVVSRKILANSLGFFGQVRRTSCSLSAVPIATADGKMQRDYWYSIARDPSRLETPEAVGRRAAERTLRRLGARKIATARVPVLFDPQVARSLLDHLFQAASGEAIYRKASFLAGKLGDVVAAEKVTLIDDPLRPGGLGSSPFDGEGVRTRRHAIVNAGRLELYPQNSYTARKLQMRPTGHAARGLAGTPGIGCGNLYLQPGTRTPDAIIADLPQGLYVTELIGFGVNLVTGDYSRGASGLWIENGQLAYPVEEITIAGNLAEMFRNIAEIGNDLEFRTAVASPTLLIEGMTVAGS